MKSRNLNRRAVLLKAARVKAALALAFGLFLTSLHGCGSPEESRSAIAQVGDRAITLKQYHQALKRLMQPGQSSTSDEMKELKKELIKQLVEEELVLGEARKLGIKVSEDELSAEVEGLKKGYGEDATFKDAVVERYGNLENWKDEIRRKLLMEKTIQQAVRDRAAAMVTESAARAYYMENLHEYDTPEQALARVIVVSSEDEAKKIRKKLTARNFASVAKEASISPEAKNGGELGYVAKGEMPRVLDDTVFRLRPGELSHIVKTDSGYHIFLSEGRRKKGRLQFKDVKDRIMEKLRKDAESRELSAWLGTLRANTRIAIREDLL